MREQRASADKKTLLTHFPHYKADWASPGLASAASWQRAHVGGNPISDELQPFQSSIGNSPTAMLAGGESGFWLFRLKDSIWLATRTPCKTAVQENAA
jgi:hypothetical protein